MLNWSHFLLMTLIPQVKNKFVDSEGLSRQFNEICLINRLLRSQTLTFGY